MEKNMTFFRQYKFTISFFFSIIIAIILFSTSVFDKIILALDDFGYVGAFLAGVLFSSTFFSASAALFFVDLGEHLNPFAIAFFGGLGAMIGDLFMYRYLKESILEEVKALASVFIPAHHREKMEAATKRAVFLWTVPFLASTLIASPLPDEIGLALFSLVNFHPKYLSVITFLLNALGIFVLVFLGYTTGS